jgi:crossover junction endodeoxyribonuclease RuvC
MISIGLDLSLTGTSVCISKHGKVVLLTTIKSKPVGPQPVEELKRILKIRDTIFEEINNHCSGTGIDIAVIEAPSFMSKGTSLTQLAGLSYLVRTELFNSGVTWALCAPLSLKKFATGKGSGDKDQVTMHVYKNWGIMPDDNNQADSLALCKIGEALCDKKAKLTVPQKEVVALISKQMK